ncbi:hypothetical protein [Sphingomonas colocasiae]|uniref:Uncharacterized protein n=1 Tax=Sphingomonas colocasiae TaxID=1848973 RepID=A0ABS7PNE8_9SPHN|nr:hypothetical protein [Sphingomonas colocasiae]MBY8822835.1 hypothetical protein [Sphingomonas colocasiae]
MARNPSWMTLAIDGWMLGVESSSVIGLRMMTLARGGSTAAAEAQRMVAEKMRAAIELHALAFTGALGKTPNAAAAKSIAHYGRKVRANRRRLSRRR